MKNLQIGDRVKVSHDKLDTVYSFGHYAPDAIGEYLRIWSTSRNYPIEISAQHMVFVIQDDLKKEKAVPADMVRNGDVLLGDGGRHHKVTQIQTGVQRRGAYAPFTHSGTIVVNQIVASNYVSLTGSTTFLGSLDMQWIAHTMVAPRRWMCRVHHLCGVEQYTEDGIATWIPYRTVI